MYKSFEDELIALIDKIEPVKNPIIWFWDDEGFYELSKDSSQDVKSRADKYFGKYCDTGKAWWNNNSLTTPN